MSAIAGATNVTWRHPEWWALALSTAAWAWMLANSGHHAHAYGDALKGWMVMSVAMMLPMVIEPIRLTAERSFWHRRHRAIAGFLAGYLGLWLLAGVAVSFLRIPHGAQNRAAAIASPSPVSGNSRAGNSAASTAATAPCPSPHAAGAPTVTAPASAP